MPIEDTTVSLQKQITKKTVKDQNKPPQVPDMDKKPVVEADSLPSSDVSKSTENDVEVSCQSKPAQKSSTVRRRQTKNIKPDNGIENKKITDYYQIRRSSRCTEAELKKQKQNYLEECIRSGKQDGLEVKQFEEKGRGVVATRQFSRGDFVVEYVGELLDMSIAKEREKKYATEERGCYIYYFTYKDRSYCIDATEESGLLGRLVNHSCKNFNCITKPIEVDGRPRLILVASRQIKTGEEILYDYGDRSSESLKAHPWLAF